MMKRRTFIGAIALLPVSHRASAAEWQPLFDGHSLEGWKETPFSGRGAVRVENGSIVLEKGRLTGITRTSPLPRSDFEFRCEAMRADGSDFFAGITFPVRSSFCSWIVGGWGGNIVGLSSIDGSDASENETSVSRRFETGRWYALRLSVTGSRIQAWIDDESLIDIDTANREVGLR